MSSAATATSAAAATTAGSGAGEGAEEAAKDSADIAAFFRSGECGPVPGWAVREERAAARPRWRWLRKVEGSDVFLPEGEGQGSRLCQVASGKARPPFAGGAVSAVPDRAGRRRSSLGAA